MANLRYLVSDSRRPSFGDLEKIQAFHNVSCWKLPNTDEVENLEENIEFAREHRASFFRFARSAIGLIAPKGR